MNCVCVEEEEEEEEEEVDWVYGKKEIKKEFIRIAALFLSHISKVINIYTRNIPIVSLNSINHKAKHQLLLYLSRVS